MSQPTELPETTVGHELFDHESIMAMLEGLSGDVNMNGLFDFNPPSGNTMGTVASTTAASAVNTLPNSRNAKRQSALMHTTSSNQSESQQSSQSGSSRAPRKERILSTAHIFQGDPMDEEDIRRCNSRRRAHILRQNAHNAAGKRTDSCSPIDANFFPELPEDLLGEEMEEAEEKKIMDLRAFLMRTIGGQPGAGDDEGPCVPFPGETTSAASSITTNVTQLKRGRSNAAAAVAPPAAPVALPVDATGASSNKASLSIESTTRDAQNGQVNHNDIAPDQQSEIEYAMNDEATENLKAMIQALEAAGQDPEKIARQVHIFQIIQANVAHNTQPPHRRLNAKDIARQGISAPRYIIGSAQVEVQSLRRPLIDPNAGLNDDAGSASGRPDSTSEMANGGDSLRKQFKTFGKKIKSTMGKRSNNDGRLMPHLTIEQQREYIERQQQLHEQLVNQMKQAALVINSVLEGSTGNNSAPRISTETGNLGAMSTLSQPSRSLVPTGPAPGFLCNDAASQRSGHSDNSNVSNTNSRHGDNVTLVDGATPLPADNEEITEEENILRQQQQHLLMQQQQLQQQHQYLQQQLLLLQQRQAQEDEQSAGEDVPSTQAVNTAPEKAFNGNIRETSLNKMTAGLAPDPQRISSTSISALLPPDPATMVVAHEKTANNFYRGGQGAASSMDSLVAQITAALDPNQLDSRRGGGTSNSTGAVTPSNLRDEVVFDAKSDANQQSASNSLSSTTQMNEAIPPPPVHRPPPAPSDTEMPRKNSTGLRSTVTTTVAGSYRANVSGTTANANAASKSASSTDSTITGTIITGNSTSSPAASPAASASKLASRQSQRFSRLMMPQTPIVEAVWSTTAATTTTTTTAATTTTTTSNNIGQKKLVPLVETTENQSTTASSPPADFLFGGGEGADKMEDMEHAVNGGATTAMSKQSTTKEINEQVASLAAGSTSNKNKPSITDDSDNNAPTMDAAVTNHDQHNSPKTSSKSVKAATLDATDKNNLLQLLPALQTVSPFTLLPELQLNGVSNNQANDSNNPGKSSLSKSLAASDYDNTMDFSDEYDEDHDHSSGSPNELQANDSNGEENEDEEFDKSSDNNENNGEDDEDEGDDARYELDTDRGRAIGQTSTSRRVGEHRRESHSRSRSRSRTRNGRYSTGRHRNKRETSGIFSAVRLRKRDSAMSVWSVDVPDQTPLPVTPPPTVPPVPRLTAEIVTLPGSSDKAETGTNVDSETTISPGTRVMSNTINAASELSLNYENSSIEWEPRPTLAPVTSSSLTGNSVSDEATVRGISSPTNPAHAINDMLQRLADTNPELLSEGYTGSIFDLWAGDNTQGENDDEEDENDEAEDTDRFDEATMSSPAQYGNHRSNPRHHEAAISANVKPISLLNRSRSVTTTTSSSTREATYRRIHTSNGVYTPMSAGYTTTGTPIDSFPHLSRARAATVDTITDSINHRRTASSHNGERLREISTDNEPSTDLFSVMASSIIGNDATTRTRTSTGTSIDNPSTSDSSNNNNTNESTTTTANKDTAEQESADSTNNETNSRKKTNAASTTAKLDDLMKELVCV